MTEAELNELDKLEREATPGPWVECEDQDRRAHHTIFGEQIDIADVKPWAGGTVEANAALMVALRNHARELIDATKELQELLRQERACPLCNTRFGAIHPTDSRLAEVLK